MEANLFTQDELTEMTKQELIDKYLLLQTQHLKLKNNHTCKPLSKTEIMINKFKPRKTKRRKQKSRELDFLHCNYRYVAFKVAYLGWDYNGLQENGDLSDTIEGVLKEALRQVKLVGRDLPVRFTKCGRTDKGVSGFVQVMSLMVRTQHSDGPHVVKWKDCMQEDNDTESDCGNGKQVAQTNVQVTKDINTTTATCEPNKECKEFDYVMMLNQVLPAEIRILGWTPVDESFSARWQCTQRVYHYYFPRGKLDVKKMNNAAQLLCGTHDYRNFCKLNVANCRVFIRRIDEFSIKPVKESSLSESYSLYYAVISASGFLYHQVRQMMTILFLIGLGREDSSLISHLLDVESCPSRPAYDLSPAYPLVLFNSVYESMKWNLDRCTAARLLMHFQTYWSELAIKTCMVRELIAMLENDSETKLTGSVDGFMGVSDSESSTIKDLSSKICQQSPAHGVNYQFLKQPCSLQHKTYKKVVDRQKCKSFEEQLEAFERKRQHSPTNSEQDTKRSCV
uniref:tRNA pseudouridine(38/39) synthase-like n=1 Tax=Phallusia mammillata TaxID=59560 RepID=A0A6F9DQK9_9ASCI|nr:tRNA pseudouridine(38/39) synthase-like [Phallusia mammillata]